MSGGKTALSAVAPFDPHSPGARAITDLFGETLIVCAVIFAIVAAVIAYALVRFRDRGGGPPAQIEGNKRLEIAWTAAPIVILVGLFTLTIRAMTAADPPSDRPPDLVVVAHQWWWEVRYKSGAVTANEIHIPVGRALVVEVQSADVIHDFWVPDLARKIDAIPGRSANIWMEADRAGTYVGACAEYCGPQHAWMRILVVAEPDANFAAWEQHTRAAAQPPSADAAIRGARAFEELTCVKCHAISGLGEGAGVGPNLTHLMGRTTLGAGVMRNTSEHLTQWLAHPQTIKTGSHMPDLKLSTSQLSDLTAYLETLE